MGYKMGESQNHISSIVFAEPVSNTKKLARIKNSIKLFSKTGYIFRRYLSFLPTRLNLIYDPNLSAALDYSLQTGRYDFIVALDKIINNDELNFHDFNNQLILSIQKHLIEPQENYNESNQHVQQGLKLIKKYLNRYFDEHKLDYHISRSYISPLSENLDKEKTAESRTTISLNEYKTLYKNRQYNRLIKTILAKIPSRIFGILIATPEATLALFGSGKFNTQGLMKIGAPAFIVNYLLYVNSIYDYFVSLLPLRPTKLKKDEQFLNTGNTVKKQPKLSTIEKKYLNILLYITGSCLGVLYFNSIYVPFGIIIWGETTTPILNTFILPLAIIASIFGLVVTISNIALLKNYLYDTYYELKEQSKNLSQISIKKIILSTLSILTIIISQAWLYKEILGFLTMMIGVPLQTATILSVTFAILSSVNGLFYAKNVYTGLDKITNFLSNNIYKTLKLSYVEHGFNIKLIINKIYMFITSASSSLYNLANFSGNNITNKMESIRTALNAASYAVLIPIIICCSINAFGVATGAALSIGVLALRKFAYCLMFFASSSANISAAKEEITIPASLSLKLKKEPGNALKQTHPDKIVYNLYSFNRIQGDVNDNEQEEQKMSVTRYN